MPILLDVIAKMDGATVAQDQISVNDTDTVRDLHRVVENAACQRLGRKVSVLLGVEGVSLPTDDAPVSTLQGLAVLEATLCLSPRLLSVSPLWGPAGGDASTLVTIRGEGLAAVGGSARISFGGTIVSCERVDATTLRCHAPGHAPGIVQVSLLRCEEEDVEDEATFQYVRLETALDAIFATTNSFCPVRSQAQRDESTGESGMEDSTR